MAFKGLRVFMSRKDFDPQFIDSAHDLLRENGAEVCICSNISCNGITDFHVLPFEHEKLVEYTNNGCNIIGPDCLLGCAKEHRPFPRQGYTCCLAMEGVKVLATGFEKNEKAEIERIVTSMCGELETKVFTNISFVIAKDVLAAKYKFAVNNLRRPILKLDWLYQCWREHRLVACEAFRLPPFVGLIICATNIPLDERKEIEAACIENGGSYSADLTKKCTHLIANVPQGDKFRVARRWGTIKIVNRQWFGQCLAAKVCLDEDLFPVNPAKEKPLTVTQVSGRLPNASSLENSKLESLMSSGMSFFSNSNSCDQGLESNDGFPRPDSSVRKEEHSLLSSGNERSGHDHDSLYLSNCRVYFCGISAPNVRKYVNMVRDGGGTRFMEFNDRVTHVIFGDLTESSSKDVRQSCWVGSIHFVFPLWLEECYQQKKEVPITEKHLITEALFQKRANFYEGSISDDNLITESMHPHPTGKQHQLPLQNSELEQDWSACHKEEIMRRKAFPNAKHEQLSTFQQSHFGDSQNLGNSCEPVSCGHSKSQYETVDMESTEGRPGQQSICSDSAVFKGCTFAISNSFPLERRAEIVQWVMEGGGCMESEGCSQTNARRKIDFLVVTHGSRQTLPVQGDAKSVSSHWIRFCLEEKKLLDLDSHVLYQPLQCQVPFPGFETFRLCVSQYEEKERLLLRNLCFVLGAKFTEKLTKKVTHLLCKVKDGQKYHAACVWGINVTTADWLFASARMDKVLPIKSFQPRKLSVAEKGGILRATQSTFRNACPGEMGSECTAELDSFRSQAAKKGSRKARRSLEKGGVGVDASMAHLSERNKHFLTMKSTPLQNGPSPLDPWDAHTVQWSGLEDLKDKMDEPAEQPTTNLREGDSNKLKRKQSRSHSSSPNMEYTSGNDLGELANIEQAVTALEAKDTQHSSDVAAVIEGLLARTYELKFPTGPDSLSVEHEISPEHIVIKRTRDEGRFKRPRLRAITSEKSLQASSLLASSPKDPPGFDESQMEPQVIGYDEDRSGKELIIERVRTRSMSTAGDCARPNGAAWRNDGLGRLFKVAEANK